MQTFLPFPDFGASARALDPRRLGKQRVECLQVVRGLTVPTHGWRHHPAVTMWRGHLEALGRYSLTCCEVWVAEGRADTCAATLLTDLVAADVPKVRTQPELALAGAPAVARGVNRAVHAGTGSRGERGCGAPRSPG